MAAPAHYLADTAERKAKEYTDQLVKELNKRIKELESRVKKLEHNGN